jgi:hypothetical protein
MYNCLEGVIMNINIVFKNKGWHFATIDVEISKSDIGNKFDHIQLSDIILDISERSDVKNIKEYLSLQSFLKKLEIKDDSSIKKFIGDNNISRIYFFIELPEKHENISIKKFKEEWWKDINPLCMKCRHKCKQSAYVKIDRCDKFEPKRGYKEKNNG